MAVAQASDLGRWLKILGEKISPAKVAPAPAAADHGPKGMLRSRQCCFKARCWIGRFTATGAKSPAWSGWCPANGVPETKNRASITKVGVPALRRIIVEMVWRMVLFQPQYKPVQKWQEVLKGPNPALKKKAVVAIGRQLMVDLWRLQTGRVTAQDLNLIMVEN